MQVNLIFLASIVWILVTKLRTSNYPQNCLYRYGVFISMHANEVYMVHFIFVFFYFIQYSTYNFLCKWQAYRPHIDPGWNVKTCPQISLKGEREGLQTQAGGIKKTSRPIDTK